MAKNDFISRNTNPLATTIRVARVADVRGAAERCLEIEAECYDIAKASAEDIAEQCSLECAIHAAMEARKVAKTAPESALYVIGEAGCVDACKIGVATNPAQRLEWLQCGNWRELSVKSLFWVVSGSAYGLEALSLRIARKMRGVIRSEWLQMEPSAAAYIIAAAAHTSRIGVADSEMWLRQRAALRDEAEKTSLSEREKTHGLPHLAACRVGSASIPEVIR